MSQIEHDTQSSTQVESGPVSKFRRVGWRFGLANWLERASSSVFLWPAILSLLFLSIFPLVVSFYISLSRFSIAIGGFELKYVGWDNYHRLLLGREQTHFLGLFAPNTPLHWFIFGLAAVGVIILFVRYLRSSAVSFGGLLGRILLVIGTLALVWMLVHTLDPAGRPGTLTVTLIFVFVGIFFQYSLGLGLALLVVQQLPGRRFFRVVFLLPMMITPVGAAYMFRMMTDTSKGPFTPVWQLMGLTEFSWVTDPWGARAAILLADTWQWTPFMFIVLLAALEGQLTEVVEAATVDGANARQIFRHITWPAILPVSLTLILIRMIEAFKIIDLPNIMTNGGPGTATESLTLQSFIAWRALNLGESAAIAYMLLVVVTFIAVAYVMLIRQYVLGKL